MISSFTTGPTPGKRARELFMALDEDGSGFLDEEEFVQVFFFLSRIFPFYIRHEDFRPSVPETLSMTLVLPPLKSETG